MNTGIVVALPNEISSLTSNKAVKGDIIYLNDEVMLMLSGAGPDNAAQASQLLINNGAKRLISWGCAAALKEGLKPGQLILPDTLQAEDLQQISIKSPWLHNTVDCLSALDPCVGSLAESRVIVAESTEKKAIHKKNRAIALDMESIAVAKTAIKSNLPVLVIRCIADPVNMDLPKAVSYALNQQGDLVLGKLLWFLLLHPSELPCLIRLGLHFSAAKNKLKLVAKQLDIILVFEQKPPKSD